MCARSVKSDSVTTWTAARQAPLSMGFSTQDHWSGLPFPPPVDLPDAEIKPACPALAEGFLTTEPPGEPKAAVLPIKKESKANKGGARFPPDVQSRSPHPQPHQSPCHPHSVARPSFPSAELRGSLEAPREL